MILRRLVAHMKQQHWTGVFIELVIVVLGVFIGIQVSNWNEARVDRGRERHALHLLFIEAQNNVAYSELANFIAQQWQQNREAALARLQGRMPEKGDATRGLVAMAVYRDTTPMHSVYDQLRASGDMPLIQSEEVRKDLALFEARMIFHDRSRREFINEAPDILRLASAYTTVTYDPSQPAGYSLVVDWKAAGKDKVLVNAVNRVMGGQIVFDKRRRALADAARTLCDALGKALHQSCAPADWVEAYRQGEPFIYK